MSADIELAEFISNLRAELEIALAASSDAEVRFIPKTLDLELSVVAEKSAEASGKISFKIFSVGAEAGGGGTLSNASTQTIKLSLEPVGKDGEQIFITSSGSTTL